MNQRTRDMLWRGAQHHWTGAEDHVVAVYAWFDAVNPEQRLWSAATISAMLQAPTQRQGCLAGLRRSLGERPARRGPKMDRYDAALAGLDALDALLSDGGEL